MKRITMLLVFLMALGFQVFAQSTVTGTVTGANDGQALPGVTVSVKGFANAGTITDASGNYSIRVPEGGNTLVFSFIGMKTKTVAIGGQSVINAQIESEDIQMDDIVVTALGVSREKKALGYSVQEVNGDELTEAREANVVNSLQGKISGAVITNSSGAVGASSRVVLRGASSLGGNNQPLFVVDGIPIDNSNFGGTGTSGVNRGSGAADINPDDIESITVLKGPNAAALYGSRASNGVILVKTKSGKNKKGMGISISNTTSFENPLMLPNYQNEYGQGSGGAFEYVNGKGGGTNDGTDESWGPKLDGRLIPQFNSPVTNGVREATPWVANPDNIKNFFETGMTNTTNVSLVGGGETSNFRLSYSQMDQSGMVPNTEFGKKTLSFNTSARPTDKMTFSLVGNYVNSGSDNMPGYGYGPDNVMQQFIWFGRQVQIADLKDYHRNADGTWYNWNTNYHNNPYMTLNENLNTMQRERFFGNAMVQYKFTDWLQAFVRTGGDIYTNLNTTRRAMDSQDFPNGYYSTDAYSFKELNSDFLVSLNKSIGSDFVVGLNVGGSRMDMSTNDNYAVAGELAVENVYNVANSLIPVVASNSGSQKRINSMYAYGQFAYKNALFMDFTARNDWSSALPDGGNSYFYPSVNLSAVLTDLLDVQSNVLSFAKVRAGWAQVGSDTGPYQLVPTVAFGGGWNDATKVLNQGIPNNLPNAALKPQFVTSIEVGADLRFFLDRVRLDFSYYTADATDQIISIPVSPATGYTSKNINAGSMTNSGIEILLSVTPIKTADFSWDVTVNYSKNKNEVVELADGVERYSLGSYWNLEVMAIPGEQYGSLYGYDFERTDAGEIIYTDGLPSQGDLQILGNYTPDWTGGLNNEINFKGFNLSALIDTRMGGDLYSMTTSWGRYAGVLDETLIGREGGIVGDGVMSDGNGGYKPNDVVVTAEQFNKAAYSNDVASSSIFDASFVKLREVKIGYTLTKLGNLPFQSANFSVVGRNLAILYSTVPHVDPETAFSSSNVQGLEFGQLPSARSIGFSVNLKF